MLSIRKLPDQEHVREGNSVDVSPLEEQVQELLVTLRVALHYIRPDSYHVFMSWDVVVERNLT